MKERLSVDECREYFNQYRPNSIHLHSSNQRGYSGSCVTNLHFDRVVIVDNPDMVLLHSDIGTVFFEKISYIEVDSDSLVSATIVNVVCDKERERYTLVVH